MKVKRNVEIEPLLVPLWPDAGRTLGLTRNLTYASAKRGEIPVVRFGSKLMVSKAKLARLADAGEGVQ